MSVLQPVVDDNGNLILHGQQGLVLPLEFYNSDGTLRDMTGASVVFEVGPTFSKALTLAATSSQMVLTLTNDDIKTISTLTNKQFVVLDESSAEPTPLWAGMVFINGWTS